MPVEVTQLHAVRWQGEKLAGFAGASDLGLMTNHLYIVPVRTDYKGCVVVSVIAWPKARCPVICRPCGNRRFVEAIHLLSIAGYEGEVQMCCCLLDPTDAERCITAGTT